ncbi:hypothetical protein ACU686_25270 [Yinghuangia aomiensis]
MFLSVAAGAVHRGRRTAPMGWVADRFGAARSSAAGRRAFAAMKEVRVRFRGERVHVLLDPLFGAGVAKSEQGP